MDQKLLNALNNIGFALEELVDAINSKSEAKTATGSAIQSGDFGADLKSINEGIKSIKADTQTIIKNQQTIIAQGKERESAKTKDIETDPKKESDIKKGVGTILLIAVAVLAIGLAFKLVGEIDVLSVMGLALGITLVAIAFEKVAQLKLGIEDATITSAVMVIASLGLMISSYVLNLVTPVSPAKMITAILISAGFALLGPSIAKLVEAFKGMSFIELVKTVMFLPIILPAISLGIAISSEILQKVQPIGFSQFISSILISAIFVVLSFGLKKIIGAFKGIDMENAAVAALSIPIIMVAMSAAILGSSYLLKEVQPMSFGQFVSSLFISIVFVAFSFSINKILKALKDTDPKVAAAAALSIPILMIAMSAAILGSSHLLSQVLPMSMDQFLASLGISILFIPLSFAASLIIKGLKGIDKSTILTSVLVIPALMVGMSTAIWLSSEILNNVTIVSEDKLINAGLIGTGLAILSLAMIPAIKVVSKVKPTDILMGVAMIPLLATAIMVSSWILSVGNYDEGGFPTTEWIKGVSLSLLVFGTATIGLGFLITASGGLGLPALALGGAGALIVAGTIAASSHVLKLGDYKTSYPGLDWAKGVSLSLVAFGSGMVLLGGIIFASFGVGLGMLKAGSNAVLMVAKTIVASSDIFANGYTDSKGNKVKPNYKSGPTREWAESISIVLGAFSPVYGMLLKNSSIFGGGVGPEDFTTAIKTVSKGIVVAAKFFASPDNTGIWGAHPTKEWAEGIGTAIGAFSPIYSMLMKSSILSIFGAGGVSPDDFTKAITTVSQGIITAAIFFAENTAPFGEGSYPSKNWSEGVGAALGAFSPVFDMLMNKSFWKSGDSVINSMVNGIISTTRAIARVAAILHVNSKYFTTTIDPNYVKSIRQNILDFSSLVQELSKSQSEEGIMSKVTNSLLGTDPITKIARQMVTLAKGYDKLSDSLIKLSGAMKLLNISDIRMLGAINPNTEVQDGKVTGSQKPTNSVNLKKGGDSPMVSNKVGIGKKGETTMKQDIEEIVKILSSIDKNSGESNTKLGDMLRKLSDESVKIAKAGS